MLAGPCHGIPCRGDPDGELCLAELSPDTLSPTATAVGGPISGAEAEQRLCSVPLVPYCRGDTSTSVSCHPGATPHSSIMAPEGQRI